MALSFVPLPMRLALWFGALAALLGSALVAWQAWTTRELLLSQAQWRVTQLERVLAASFAYTDARVLDGAALERLRREFGLDYLAMHDRQRQLLLAAGEGRRLAPAADLSAVLDAGGRYEGELLLANALLRYGYSMPGLRLARLEGLRAAAAIAGGGTLLAFALGAAVGLRQRRLLARVDRALGRFAGGTPVRAPLQGPGEIAAAARRINDAAAGLDRRLSALTERDSRLAAIAECAFGVEAWFNPDGKLLWVNSSIERITGYTPLECVLAGNLVEMLVYQKDRKFALEQGRRALQGAQGENLEFRLQRKDGSIVWIAVYWQAIHDAGGRYLGLRVSVDDIQQRKQAEMQLLETVAELRRAQSLKEFYLTRSNDERARLQALLDVMKIGVLFFDREDRVLFSNEAFLSIWRLPRDEVLTGTRKEALLARTAPLRSDDAAYRAHIAEVLQRADPSAPFDSLLTDGRTVTDVSTLVPGGEPGSHIGRVWIFEDVTEQKRAAAQLIALAERDPLTNLYNRRRFHEELERMLADAERREVQLGLLVIDLDGFKPINDRYGHQAGDQVLVGLASEVGAAVRRNEIFFRVGGDEFALLAPDSSEEEMIGLARRILAKINDMRFVFEQHEIGVSASVGIALYPAHARDGRELVERSDQAMYRAKSGGKNAWEVWCERSAA